MVRGSQLHPPRITCNFQVWFLAVCFFFGHLIEVNRFDQVTARSGFWGRVWPPIRASTYQSSFLFEFTTLFNAFLFILFIFLKNPSRSCGFG